jgi:hypothetical protein
MKQWLTAGLVAMALVTTALPGPTDKSPGGGDGTVAALRKKLRSEDEVERLVAVKRLAKLGPKAAEALPELKELAANDPDEDVRAVAARAVKAVSAGPPAEEPPAVVRNPRGEPLAELFRDMAEAAGVSFASRNGEEADQYTLLESVGGGVALLDYDGDGLLDVFIPGGGSFEGPGKKQVKGRAGKLFRNLGAWKFRDVTREAGLDQPVFYAHGAAVADYDRDGWPDLLVTGWGRLALFHNAPDGKGGRRFVDVTERAGLKGDKHLWATSAAWGDLDSDGYPDLYVCQYADWSPDNNPECKDKKGRGPGRDICSSRLFKGLPHRLFWNRGDGTFRDVSKEAGLRADPSSRGLGVLIVDVNGDGKPDIYVANDGTDNLLYLNESKPGRDIRLKEQGLLAGVARDSMGRTNGSRGTAAFDFEGSGRPSLWCVNSESEQHGLYRHDQEGRFFLFASRAAGIGVVGRSSDGFGTGLLDVDGDGSEDIVVATGHVARHPERGEPGARPLLLRSRGARFVEVGSQGGFYFRRRHNGRGLAVGDLDNDGRPDLLISHLNAPVALLQNRTETGHHWLGVELVGDRFRDLAGVKVVVQVGGRQLSRFVQGGGSYLSSSDRRLLFGLGKEKRIERLTIVWKPGREQRYDRLQPDRYHCIKEELGR